MFRRRPGPYELTKSAGVVVEQIIRPTGLIDPEVEVRPVKGQIDDLLHEIRERAKKNERVLVTTLTKRMAEDLAEYYSEVGVRCRYMHSEIETLERIKILRDLRKGEFDVLIGINLLREGLDLPEVSLVAILDADKEGFLRSAGSLIQTIGRCARNLERPRDSLRRQDDRLDEEGDRRNLSPPRHSAGLQRGARHHAGEHRAAAGHVAGCCRRCRLRRPDQRSRTACRSSARRKNWTPTLRSWKATCARPPSASSSSKPRSCATPSASCGPKSSCSRSARSATRVSRDRNP